MLLFCIAIIAPALAGEEEEAADKACDRPVPEILQPLCVKKNGERETVFNRYLLEILQCKAAILKWNVEIVDNSKGC